MSYSNDFAVVGIPKEIRYAILKYHYGHWSKSPVNQQQSSSYRVFNDIYIFSL